MMKKTVKKLTLNKETLQDLDSRNLHEVVGEKPPVSVNPNPSACFC
jgi:hypothetical protein